MALLHSQDNFQSIVVASDNKQERNYHLCPKKLQTIGSRTTLQQYFTKRYFIKYTMKEGEHYSEYMIYSIIMTDQSKSVNNERLNFFSSKLVTFFPVILRVNKHISLYSLSIFCDPSSFPCA